MARTPNDLLAGSLEALHQITEGGARSVLRSDAITRVHRERLTKAGFLEEIMRGWLAVNSRPGARRRVDEAWSTVFWEFAAAYLADRFGDAWCVSPETSISLLAGNRSVPAQLIVRSPSASNDSVALPDGTSMFLYKADVPAERRSEGGMVVMGAEHAVCNLSPNAWRSIGTDVVSVLGSVRGTSGLLRELLGGGRSLVAGRVAGALRHLGRTRDADGIMSAMTSAGYAVREENPFDGSMDVRLDERRAAPPAATRIRVLWAKLREGVLREFTSEPQPIEDVGAYLATVDANYVADAYNSLSIEGYQVSAELIERVRAGAWNPDEDGGDWDLRNALAARGYWLAFQEVKSDLPRFIAGEDAGAVLWDRHQDWYRAMFSPSVTAGILRPEELAGYRRHPIYLRGSSHVPTAHDWVPDAVEALFDCVSAESDPRVKAVLAPYLFTYIHPFVDGNGRTARFMMNALLAEGGFPWTVVPYGRRDEYLACLEAASRDEDSRPLAAFVQRLVLSPPPPRPGETAWSKGDRPAGGPRR